MSDLAGQLDIQIQRGGAPARVTIDSTRPVTAARVFAGKPVAEVAAQLPLLFSVCGTAQAAAFATACEAALNRRPQRATARARALLLSAERIKEHLWRLLLDWPRALEPITLEHQGPHPLPPDGVDERAVAGVMRAFLNLRAAVGAYADPFLPGVVLPDPPADVLARAKSLMVATAAREVFGQPPAEWLETVQDPDALRRWAESNDTIAAWLVRVVEAVGLAALGRCELATLPDGGAELLAELAPDLGGEKADAFVARPALASGPAETTPFSRELRRAGPVAALSDDLGNGLLTRLTALLMELARACVQFEGPDAATDHAEPMASGLAHAERPAVGLGASSAARGLLVHRVALLGEADRATIADYRILAPTEWNFHPAGVVATALSELGERIELDAPQLEARARLVVTAVDPCVDYRLRLN